jgi:septum site-determining protein MinD
MIASGKGGTGKTSVSAGLASALSILGRKVCAVDMDAGLPNLDLVLGMPEAGIIDFADVALGSKSLEEAVTAHPHLPRLYYLGAPDAIRAESVSLEAFQEMVKALSEQFDYCILDVPAGVGPFFSLAASVADRALLVATPDTPCLRDAGTVLAELTRLEIEDVRLVLNMVDKSRVARKNAYNIDQSMDVVGLPLVGVIFRDDNMAVAAHHCKALFTVTRRGAARDLMDLAKRLENFPVRPRF